jgi:hypothetical protein
MRSQQSGEFAVEAFASFALLAIVAYVSVVLCFGEKERTS